MKMEEALKEENENLIIKLECLKLKKNNIES